MNDDGEPVKGDNGMTPKKKPLDDVGSMDGNVSKLDGVGADGVTVEKDGGNDPAGVPIGQLCYGHDGESLSGSPSLDYSGSLDDSGHAFTAGVVDSDATVLVNNVVDSRTGDVEKNINVAASEKTDNVVSEEDRANNDEQKLSPGTLKRSYSMPETSDKDGHYTAAEGGGLTVPSTRLPSASMASSPTKTAAPSEQPKQQQHTQQTNTLSLEEDEVMSVALPQTLQESTIVEKSPAERYIRFKEKLGSGAYKDVYRAYDTIEGIEVAWNVVKLGGVPKAERVRIVNEVRLLERLHHPNIISFHGSWVNRETERVIFVTEILSSGTLKSFVQKVQLIRWRIFKRWAIQILKGLEYLHSQDPPIIHRDLKCDNIFINGTSGDLRIGDFGLSTAISRKNQPLSVLGTPEFMAPELYDENYDEKVDIYAFGMLLLEIITNQVPYHECSNPAQIYKKVSSGIPPASLRRVKSENARNFILLCLGIGKDASLRPSATELLSNHFLEKHANDDGTIEVEPAIENMVIDETAPLEPKSASLRNGKGVSLTISDTSELSADRVPDHSSSKFGQVIDGHELPSKGGFIPLNSEQDAIRDESTVSSKLSEHASGDDDHFGEMPENEANMKPVKVLMGRDTALDDDEEPPSQQFGETSLSQPSSPRQSMPPKPVAAPAPIQAATNTLSRSVSEADASSMGSAPVYKVSAVSHPENPSSSEAINLALTLPDENQTTIEFEFDLVNDDPVQVAKEMVMELDEVPNDAVLDISEAISGVARHARQQNVIQQKQKQQQGMMMHTSAGIMPSQGIPPPQQQQPSLGGQQQLMYGAGYSGMGYQTPGAPMMSSQLGLGSDINPATLQHHQSTPNLAYHTPNDTNNQIHQQTVPSALGFQTASGHTPGQSSLLDHQQQHQQNIPFQTPGGATNMQSNVMNSQQQSFGLQTPSGSRQQSGEGHSQARIPHHLRMGSDFSAHQPRQLSPVPQPSQVPVQQAQHLPMRTTSTPQLTQPYLPQQNILPSSSIDNLSLGEEMIPLKPPQMAQSAANNQESQSLHDASTVQSHDSGVQSAPTPIPQHKEAAAPAPHPPHMVVVPESSELEDAGTDDDNEVDAEEMRKLEEEFEKRLQRAKKSYGTRMDNLHRSKVEAEAQHQMTLEKHEKERIEFEKRVRLAEEEQNRRLSQIEKEFMEKKHQVRQQRVSQCEKPPLPPLPNGGHKRSSSHFDGSMQRPTPVDLRRNMSMQHPTGSDHRRNHSTQSTLSASDISEDQLHVDVSPRPPLSGGLFIEDMKQQSASNSHPVRQIESSPSLREQTDTALPQA